MRAITPEICWHWTEAGAPMPVLGLDFHHVTGEEWRLATCGGDNAVKIWKCERAEDGRIKMVFLSDLKRHQRTVNCVRFSPDGRRAAAGEDSRHTRVGAATEPGSRGVLGWAQGGGWRRPVTTT